MGRIYIVLPSLEPSQYNVDFSFSASDLTLGGGNRESPFQFMTDKAHVPEGAAVIEWSDAIGRFIKQFD